jgi:ATP-dependent DNA helicase RecG
VRADPESVSPGDLTQLRGVGPALAEKLGKLGVHVQQDLLFVLPFRYEDRTRIMPIGGLLPGQRVVVEADVELTEVVYRRRRTMLCTIADGTGILTLRFFYFSRAQQNGLARGRRVRCYGEVRKGPNGLEMVHPEYRLLSEAEQGALEEHLTPIYPATEGVQQARIRNLIGQLLDNPAQQIDEVLLRYATCTGRRRMQMLRN